MVPTGLEGYLQNKAETPISENGGSHSGTLGSETGLRLVIEAWPTLGTATQHRILRLVAKDVRLPATDCGDGNVN